MARADHPDDTLYATVLDHHPDTVRPRIAFCHGLFGQGKNWTAIGKQFAEDYHVALIDLPDHGRSPWTDDVSYPAMAGRLADYLADASAGQVSPWTVVGHSMGGKIAMTLALTRPELVERLVVVDIAPVDYGDRGEFDDYVAAMRRLDLTSISSRQQADDQLADGVPDPTVRSFLLQNFRRGGDGTANWHWQMNLDLLGDRLRVLSGFPDLGTGPYAGPTLWVAGAESDYIQAGYATTMKRLFPQVRTVTVKNAAHWVHAEQPEVFVGILRAFLARTEPG